MYKIVNFDFDCGRQGRLEGLTLLGPEGCVQWDRLVDSGDEVYFGEVLGKHSEVFGPIEDRDFSAREVSVDDAIVLARVLWGGVPPEGYVTISGCNPLDYMEEECNPAPPC